ncbi:hypothetical protein ACQBAT_14110 [Ornithinimicrobium sp. Y1847]|uniref:hypothetical protein n=1 Tax=Ornithinimicrobium sp. Y1847 TaxID=3405419 RepID=UPI003B671115
MAQSAIDDLGLSLTAPELSTMITVQVPAGSAVVDITAAAATPEEAVVLADAVAQAYVHYRVDRSGQLQAGAGGGGGDERSDRAIVLNAATVPERAAGPPVVVYPVAGAGLMLILGTALALVLKRRDLTEALAFADSVDGPDRSDRVAAHELGRPRPTARPLVSGGRA